MKTSITVRVPATTANLGPGFDTLGVALQLYNTIRVSKCDVPMRDGFLLKVADAYGKKTGRNIGMVAVAIQGDIPRSRGLGSSAAVRLGVIGALNVMCGEPLSQADLLDLLIELEGHPDNAVPAFLGGFAISNAKSHIQSPVAEELNFIALVPSTELPTKKARAVLPKQYARADAVANIQNASLVSAAFLSQQYELLAGVGEDRVHEPYRGKLIPGFAETIKAAHDAGAAHAYLSGAGSTIMALSLKNPQKVASAMVESFENNGGKVERLLMLKADNMGYRLIPGD